MYFFSAMEMKEACKILFYTSYSVIGRLLRKCQPFWLKLYRVQLGACWVQGFYGDGDWWKDVSEGCKEGFMGGNLYSNMLPPLP